MGLISVQEVLHFVGFRGVWETHDMGSKVPP